MISSITSGASALDLATLQRLSSARSGSTASADEGRAGRTDGRRPPGPPPEAIEAAAKALDMSESDVQDALAGGSTLQDLADSKGVSQEDLLAAVTDGLAAGAAKHGRQLSTEQLAEFASHVIDGTPPRPTGGAAGGAGSDLAASGLRDIAAAAGISEDDLMAAIREAFTSATARSAYRSCTAEALLGTSTTGTLADTAA